MNETKDLVTNIDVYQQLAQRTVNKEKSEPDRFIAAALGLTGEAGEFADLVKKIMYHDHEVTAEVYKKLLKELGDVMWYIAEACTVLGVSMSTVAALNITKLKERYPDGFSPEASQARVDEKENNHE